MNINFPRLGAVGPIWVVYMSIVVLRFYVCLVRPQPPAFILKGLKVKGRVLKYKRLVD